MHVMATSRTTGTPTPQGAATKPGDVLDKHDFLRLLTVQLKYQDPMEPINDQDFIAQLAQFSALEQMQNLSDSLEHFVEEQRAATATAQAASLLGRTVTVWDAVAEQAVEGVVEAVRFDLGVPLLVIGDRSYTLGDVYEVQSGR